jgi:hypothetical protein
MSDNKYYGSITRVVEKSTEQKRRDKEVIDYQNRSVRLAADGGRAEVVVNPTNVIIASDENTAIGVSDGCIILDGRVSITRAPDDIMINGFWRLNEELLLELPSTLANPISVLNFKYPSYIKKMSKIIKLLTA